MKEILWCFLIVRNGMICFSVIKYVTFSFLMNKNMFLHKHPQPVYD